MHYYSNFIETDLLTSETSTRTIALLKKHFARYGTPRVIVSDGGPQFTSQEFDSFMTSWGISHYTSSPMHQRANSKAESAVKVMKSLLIKTYKDFGDPHEAILEQRITPRQDTGYDWLLRSGFSFWLIVLSLVVISSFGVLLRIEVFHFSR